MPSTQPTVASEAPSTVVMKTGIKLWTSSDDMSINIDTKPMAQMPAGNPRGTLGAAGSWAVLTLTSHLLFEGRRGNAHAARRLGRVLDYLTGRSERLEIAELGETAVRRDA